MRPLEVRRLGRVPYARGLELQERLVADRQAGRIPDQLLLLEHDPVFTLGRNARTAKPFAEWTPSSSNRALQERLQLGPVALL